MAEVDPHKQAALNAAVPGGGTAAEIVARAQHYHSFLTGTVAKPAAAAAPASGAAAKPAGDKPAKATPAAGTATAAPAKPGAAQPKPTTAAAKPATAAAKPAAKGAPAAPSGDTKDPNGKNTYDDVVAALQKVMRSVPGDNDKKDKGRVLAYGILADKGNGVKGVRDLKPALYDAVVDACEAAVAKKPAAAKAASVAVDELGEPIDTSGAAAETSGEDDPPEGGSGEDV